MTGNSSKMAVWGTCHFSGGAHSVTTGIKRSGTARAGRAPCLASRTRPLSTPYIDPADGRITFRTYAERWRGVQPHREGTAISVEQDLRLHIYPVLGQRPVAAVRASEVQALVAGLSNRIAASTLERIYGRVRAVFRSAVHDRVIASSPCVDVRLPRKPPDSAITDVLTTEHVLDQAVAIAPRYRALVLVGAGTGLRPGELFGLSVNRIDFLRRTIRVDRQLVRARGLGVRLAEPKTVASYRTVPLPATVVDALAAHVAEWPASADDLVFRNERDDPTQQQPFAAVWKTARSGAHLPTWATPHDLRHYCASLLIRSGASVKVVQARLGHSSAKVTLDVYGHFWPDEEDRTRAAVDAAYGLPAASPRPSAVL